MKATGIVRRIDDLGRISIPKEIRRSLHLKENTPMEIFIEDGALVFKKYHDDHLDEEVCAKASAVIPKLRFSVYNTSGINVFTNINDPSDILDIVTKIGLSTYDYEKFAMNSDPIIHDEVIMYPIRINDDFCGVFVIHSIQDCSDALLILRILKSFCSE